MRRHYRRQAARELERQVAQLGQQYLGQADRSGGSGEVQLEPPGDLRGARRRSCTGKTGGGTPRPVPISVLPGERAGPGTLCCQRNIDGLGGPQRERHRRREAQLVVTACRPCPGHSRRQPRRRDAGRDRSRERQHHLGGGRHPGRARGRRSGNHPGCPDCPGCFDSPVHQAAAVDRVPGRSGGHGDHQHDGERAQQPDEEPAAAALRTPAAPATRSVERSGTGDRPEPGAARPHRDRRSRRSHRCCAERATIRRAASAQRHPSSTCGTCRCCVASIIVAPSDPSDPSPQVLRACSKTLGRRHLPAIAACPFGRSAAVASSVANSPLSAR